MNAIRIINSCAASGVHLEAGQVYAVPDQVSAKDAAILVGLGKAGAVDAAPPAEKPARARHKTKAD